MLQSLLQCLHVRHRPASMPAHACRRNRTSSRPAGKSALTRVLVNCAVDDGYKVLLGQQSADRMVQLPRPAASPSPGGYAPTQALPQVSSALADESCCRRAAASPQPTRCRRHLRASLQVADAAAYRELNRIYQQVLLGHAAALPAQVGSPGQRALRGCGRAAAQTAHAASTPTHGAGPPPYCHRTRQSPRPPCRCPATRAASTGGRRTRTTRSAAAAHATTAT
jgi:hypothetical protein